jgi:hypothetical protein
MDGIKPEALGFSSARLARINTAMQRYVDEKKLAGIVTLIARRGKVVHEEIIGILMLQYMPSDTYPVVADFRTLAYQALVD